MKPPSVVCKNLHKVAEANGSNILKECNLNFSGSGLAAIVGPSGAGKTSLLYCLSGLDMPTSGEVYINEKNIYTYNENQRSKYLRENVSFIFQNYNLLDYLTVKENILLSQKLARRNVSERKLISFLNKFGIFELSNKKVSQLSGGEQQRVAICRAVLLEPSVIFADEPTSALDSKNSSIVLKYLKDISFKNTLVFMVTHDIPSASIADNLIFMKDGKIV